MASFNKVILIGNMTADPELKQTQTGVSVSSFSLAVNRKFSKDGEQSCDFINIVTWRQQAEFVCKYFRKGNPILICGQIQTRSWTDNQGQKRYATEVVADEVSFVASSSQGTSQGTPTENQNAPYVPDAYKNPSPGFVEIPNEEDLPF